MKRHLLRIAHVGAVLIFTGLASTTSADVRDDDLSKGETVWRAGGNVAFSHGGESRREFGSMTLAYERGMSDVVGPGFLRGRLTMNIELIPLLVLSQESTTYAAGVTFMGRHYLRAVGRVRPFITLGIGMLISRDEIPLDVANLNFTPQAGAGIALSDGVRRLYSIEYRFHHLSNGGRVDPNPGINSSLIQFAVTFSRTPR